jgi:hypothetical protein
MGGWRVNGRDEGKGEGIGLMGFMYIYEMELQLP